jgi:hypothetical protein
MVVRVGILLTKVIGIGVLHGKELKDNLSVLKLLALTEL